MSWLSVFLVLLLVLLDGPVVHAASNYTCAHNVTPATRIVASCGAAGELTDYRIWLDSRCFWVVSAGWQSLAPSGTGSSLVHSFQANQTNFDEPNNGEAAELRNFTFSFVYGPGRYQIYFLEFEAFYDLTYEEWLNSGGESIGSAASYAHFYVYGPSGGPFETVSVEEDGCSVQTEQEIQRNRRIKWGLVCGGLTGVALLVGLWCWRKKPQGEVSA